MLLGPVFTKSKIALDCASEIECISIYKLRSEIFAQHDTNQYPASVVLQPPIRARSLTERASSSRSDLTRKRRLKFAEFFRTSQSSSRSIYNKYSYEGTICYFARLLKKALRSLPFILQFKSYPLNYRQPVFFLQRGRLSEAALTSKQEI